jgi:hypothetical protein
MVDGAVCLGEDGVDVGCGHKFSRHVMMIARKKVGKLWGQASHVLLVRVMTAIAGSVRRRQSSGFKRAAIAQSPDPSPQDCGTSLYMAA